MPILPIDKNYLTYAKTIIYDIDDLTLEDKDFLTNQIQVMSIVQSCLQDFSASESEDSQQLSLPLLFKHHLLSLGFVFVDHVEKLVEDDQGVHELDSWYSLSLTNPNINREIRDNLPKAIERIQAAQLYFDTLMNEHPVDFMSHLWEAYLKHFPNEEDWFFPICPISAKKDS